MALVPGCCSCQIRVTCCPRSAVGAFDLLAVQFHFVQLQFFARTEVIETPVIIRESFYDNNREIIFHYFFFTVFFIGFSYYTYRSQKYFLFFFLIICDLTRRDRFLIHAKWPRLSLCESCRYRRLTSFFFLLSVSRRKRTCLFSMPYTLIDTAFNRSNLEMSFKVKVSWKRNICEIQYCIMRTIPVRFVYFSAGYRAATTRSTHCPSYQTDYRLFRRYFSWHFDVTSRAGD